MWSTISVPAKLLRLDQRWNLFAPRPFTDDGWDIIEGHLSDGRRVDLFNHGVEVSFDKPRDVYALYGLSHRRQYTLELRKSFNEKYRTLYAEYLCRTWNTSHSGSEHLESLTHIFMLEKTTAPGEPQGSAVPSPLISWTCSSV